jgi:Tol biopolymer transport system component
MHGDFDVTLEFGDLQSPSINAACGIGLFAGDKHLALIRRRGERLFDRAHVTFVTPTASGGERRRGEDVPTTVDAGRFRIVRRGDTVTTLFADNDSSAFRVVGEQTWEDCGELPATLDIRTMAHGGGRTQVTWKRFEVAADRLMRIPTEPSKPVVFTMNADGSEVKQLTHPMPQFVWHASPEWSPDGKHIVFDAWTGRAESSHIYIMNADGSELTDLGTGIIPSFSPDGRRIAFTWGGHGTTIMNIDGSGREVLTREGWGCQWSPDGRWIAYSSYNGLGGRGPEGNITLIDVDTRETRLLLEGEQAGRYTRIQWNMGWSPDSRQIIFKGDRRDGSEAAIVSVEGSSTEFRIVTSENVSGDFDWHADGRHILLGKGGKLQIYDVETGLFQLLPGQPMDTGNGGPFWDPAGERIVFTSRPKPEPVPW